MLFYYLNVFLILLTWSSQAVSQTPFQQTVGSLNPYANNCIARAASFNGCAANDFNCQCTTAGQDKIIGPNKKPSPQGACIFKDCGPKNATDVQSTFGTICNDILADHASSASAAQAAPTSQASAVTPNPVTTTQVIVPTTLPAPSPTTTPTPIDTLTPVPEPATSQAPVTFITVTQTPPADTVTAIPAGSPPGNTPALVQSLASASASGVAVFTPSAASSLDPSFSSTESAAFSAEAPPSTSSPAVQASSIAESSPSATPPPPSKKRLPPLAIAGITTLVVGFIATILFLIFFQLRRRKRKSYIADHRLDEKLHPETEDGLPSPPNSGGRGLHWDGRGKNKISTMMGVEIGPRPKSKPTEGEEERPKFRGKGAGESAGGGPKHPTSFPMIGTGTPQGVDTRSPPGTGNSMRRVGTIGSAGSAQPLKSAMKKPRDRPKSRPLIAGEGGEIKFGFDPLGSNPRSPT
ncbi:hypothetical protein BDZ45DRAFT_76465 [Acephala macrosclerotiorum]|nr:hypothetical protein BDZ45DRAFT_76465 [Acephala macrosclerotiorum]